MDRQNNIAHKKQAKYPYCLHACKEWALVEIDSRETKKNSVNTTGTEETLKKETMF